MKDWHNIISGFRRYMPNIQLHPCKMEELFIKHGFTQTGDFWGLPGNGVNLAIADTWLSTDGRCRFVNRFDNNVIKMVYMAPFTIPSGSPEKDYRYLAESDFEEFLKDIKVNRNDYIIQNYNDGVNEALAKLD